MAGEPRGRNQWLRPARLALVLVVLLGACCVSYVAMGKRLGRYAFWTYLVSECGVVDGTRGWLDWGRPSGFSDCESPDCAQEVHSVCTGWRTAPRPAQAAIPTPSTPPPVPTPVLPGRVPYPPGWPFPPGWSSPVPATPDPVRP